MPLLWIKKNQNGTETGTPGKDRPGACSEADAGNGARGDLSQEPQLAKRPWPDVDKIPVFTEEFDHSAAKPGVGYGYNICEAWKKICLPGGDTGLVLEICPVVGFIGEYGN